MHFINYYCILRKSTFIDYVLQLIEKLYVSVSDCNFWDRMHGVSSICVIICENCDFYMELVVL